MQIAVPTTDSAIGPESDGGWLLNEGELTNPSNLEDFDVDATFWDAYGAAIVARDETLLDHNDHEHNLLLEGCSGDGMQKGGRSGLSSLLDGMNTDERFASNELLSSYANSGV